MKPRTKSAHSKITCLSNKFSTHSKITCLSNKFSNYPDFRVIAKQDVIAYLNSLRKTELIDPCIKDWYMQHTTISTLQVF